MGGHRQGSELAMVHERGGKRLGIFVNEWND